MRLRRRREKRPKSSTGRKSPRSYGNTSTPSIWVSPHSKEDILLLVWVSQTCRTTRTLRSGTSLSGHLLPLLRRGRSSTSSPMVKRTQTILTGIRSLRAIQVIKACITCATNLITSIGVVNMPHWHKIPHCSSTSNFPRPWRPRPPARRSRSSKSPVWKISLLMRSNLWELRRGAHPRTLPNLLGGLLYLVTDGIICQSAPLKLPYIFSANFFYF